MKSSDVLKTVTFIYFSFNKLRITFRGIHDNIDLYDNKICVISAFNSKGLEFDGVIVIDSDKIYSTQNDRNILYVAATRALHKLTILSINKESKFIKDYKENI